MSFEHVRIPTIVETTRAEAMAYHFHATDDLGWAICTVNDRTGELLIMSDWTEPCGHRWPVQHLGSPSLTHFLADRVHFDYLVGKLLPERRRMEFSAERTVRLMKERILDMRRERCGKHITKEAARAAWNALEEITHYDDSREFVENIPDLYRHHVCAYPDLEDLLEEETREAWSLKAFILPALSKACSAEVQRRAFVAAHGPQPAVAS